MFNRTRAFIADQAFHLSCIASHTRWMREAGFSRTRVVTSLVKQYHMYYGSYYYALRSFVTPFRTNNKDN